MYSEEKNSPKTVEVLDNRLDFNLDNEDRPADSYLEL